MSRKKIIALITTAFIAMSSIQVAAKPLGLYLQSKDNNNEVIYISYSDYIIGYLKDESVLKDDILKKYDIVGITVNSGNNKKVVDYKEYVKEYEKNKVDTLDEYTDQASSKEYNIPDEVKKVDKNGKIDEGSIASIDKLISIKDVKLKNKGKKVATKGIVTSKIGNSAFIQDETSGIYIYGGNEKFSELKIGNEVALSGTLDEYKGIKQIKDIKAIVCETENNKLPEPKVVKADKVADDNLVGSLLKVEGLTIKQVTNGRNDKGQPVGYDIVLTDGTSNVNLRVDKWLDPYIESSEFNIGDKVDVTAPLTKFNKTYQMMIGDIKDVKVVKKGDGTVPGVLIKTISEIQGKAHRSPYENKDVGSVEGVVTVITNDKYQKGFYMQSVKPDKDKATSEGIFVSYKDNAKVKPGHIVKVNGTVNEVISDSERDETRLTETTISAYNVTTVSENNKLPDMIEIDMKGKLLENIDDDGLKDFDPDDDAIDYYESLEGMLVNIKDPLIVGADDRYGEIAVLTNNGEASKEDLTKNGGIKADKKGDKEDFNPEIITIDDVIIPISDKNGFLDKDMKVAVGDKFTGDVKGIMSYGFGKYKVLNIDKLPKIKHGKTEREVASIDKAEGKITVASYNIENFNKGDASKVDGIARDIVENLKTPDIIGLIEVQDNDGDKDTGITSASENYEALINSINSKSKVEYGFVEIAPENNKDGGAPGGNIRPGFIYRKDRVKLVDKQIGDTKTDVQATENGLSVNPGRIGNTNPAFDSSRKSLAAEFEFNGEKVIVIANHLGSKRGDQYLFGAVQPPQRPSEAKRHEQAKTINNFVKELREKNPNTNVIALGDMNDFEFSDTITFLEGNEMKDMINTLPRLERFSYVYCGNSQVLDHIVVSNNLLEKTKVDIVNINSQFTKGYGRLSDHDPVLVQIDLGKVKENNTEDSKNKEDKANTDNKQEIKDSEDNKLNS